MHNKPEEQTTESNEEADSDGWPGSARLIGGFVEQEAHGFEVLLSTRERSSAGKKRNRHTSDGLGVLNCEQEFCAGPSRGERPTTS